MIHGSAYDTSIITDVFQQYVSVTGAVSDSDTGLYKITAAQYDALHSLIFTIGGVSIFGIPFEIYPCNHQYH